MCEISEAEKNLKPLLTDEFLSVLMFAANTCGWNVDYVGSIDFVLWCRDVAGKKDSGRLEDLRRWVMGMRALGESNAAITGTSLVDCEEDEKEGKKEI
jgi:hypothetical protein